MSIEALRVDFEAWHAREHYALNGEYDSTINGYRIPGAHSRWAAYQAGGSRMAGKDLLTEAKAEVLQAINNQPDDAWRNQFFRVAVALKCLPSSFVDGNAHVLRQAQLMAAQYVAPTPSEAREPS